MAYWLKKTTFEPFNDTQYSYGVRNLGPGVPTVSGSTNLSALDNYRQGVNLRTVGDIYRSNQVKISVGDSFSDLGAKPNGRLSHLSKFQTFGQAMSIVQFTENVSFDDSHKQIEGNVLLDNGNRIPNTVEYLVNSVEVAEGRMDPSEIYPIYMNGGPQLSEEAVIEPLPIPYHLATNESPQELGRGFFATIEGGNVGDERRFGSSVTNQRVDRDLLSTDNKKRPFLEQGAVDFFIRDPDNQNHILNVVHARPGFVQDQTVFAKIEPWRDEAPGLYWARETATVDLVGKTQHLLGNYTTDDTELQTRDKRSSTAGFSYYGPNAGYYGTDSVAFGNLLRGT